MAGIAGGRKGGKRKHGRDKDKCARYRLEGRREKNKERKRKKHQKHLDKLKIRNV